VRSTVSGKEKEVIKKYMKSRLEETSEACKEHER
jgi:hypothetical protein